MVLFGEYSNLIQNGPEGFEWPLELIAWGAAPVYTVTPSVGNYQLLKPMGPLS
jgi:hypothetical protein